MSQPLSERIEQARTGARPLVMGVVNVTPDSFSDGGKYYAPGRAVEHALALAAEGADILDVGGQSTRPGSEPVDIREELGRVVPVIEQIVRATSVPVSVDTTRPEVMRQAVAAGAVMVNDINGLRADGAIETVAGLGVVACIMHMLGTPRTMQQNPHYEAVVDEIRDFLDRQAARCLAAGVARSRIVIDPGFGFGKTLAHNLELLARLDELAAGGWPVLVGLSRKSMLGAITGRTRPAERLAASLAAQVVAAQAGAAIIRAHDVAETVDALKILQAVREAG